MGEVRALRAGGDEARRPTSLLQPRRRLDAALALGDPAIVFQPILDLASGFVRGYEALARFPHLDLARPDIIFANAHAEGRGHDLESLAIAKAIELGAQRPTGTILSLNVSPSTLLTRAFLDVVPDDLEGLQFEITEHEQIADRDDVLTALGRLHRRGATVAIDDMGEGYAGLQQLMALRPDVVKLDRSVVDQVADNPGQIALIEAIVRYAQRTDALVCAEGVEQLEDLAVLADLDVAQAQGFVIARPTAAFEAAAPDAHDVCINALSRVLEVGDPEQPGDPDLAGVLARIATTQTLDELARLMGWVSALIGCDRTALSLIDDHMTTLQGIQEHAWLPIGRTFRIADFPLTDEVLRRNVAAQVIVGAPGADESETRFLRDEGYGALLLVPVYSRTRPVGLVECYMHRATPWTRHQIRSLRCVTAVIGPMLENLRRDRL